MPALSVHGFKHKTRRADCSTNCQRTEAKERGVADTTTAIIESEPSRAPGALLEGDVCQLGPRASWSLRIIALLSILAALYFARDILIPIVFAVLLALLLRPMYRQLQRLRVPNFIAAFVLVASVALVFGLGVVKLAGQAQGWLSEAPETVRIVSRMVPDSVGPFADIARTKEAVKDLAGTNGETSPLAVEVHSDDFAYTVLGVSSHFLGATVIVFVVSFFLLALSDLLLRQAVQTQQGFCEKRTIVQLVQNVEQGVSRYLLTVTVINIGLGIATAIVLWLLGIPNYILWGVLAGTSNYVPHVGAFLCMVVLFFVGAVTYESIGYGAVTAGAFVVLTSLESYFITPLVLSKSLHLSPLASILAILFCGWMWGVAGGLMAAPLLAVLKITCDQFESLRGLRTFLSGAEPGPAAKTTSGTAAGSARAPAPAGALAAIPGGKA
jgi:predicted PurR-regulated permease PerM